MVSEPLESLSAISVPPLTVGAAGVGVCSGERERAVPPLTSDPPTPEITPAN